MIDLQSLRKRREAVERIARRNGVTCVRVFGSVLRGQPREGSDLDLLVSMEPGRGLFDLIAFEQEVSRELGVAVQALSDGGLSPTVGARIAAEASPL